MGEKHSKHKRYRCLKCGRPISHKGNCFACNIKSKQKDNNTFKKSFQDDIPKSKYNTYKDKKGYDREYPKHTNLIHRRNAYKYIYLKNRSEYKLPFSAYDVHHIDGNKNNNHSSNLKIVTRHEHQDIHEKERLEKYLMSLRPWEAKKWIVNNYGDFSLIRLLFFPNMDLGERIISGLLLGAKVGIILGVVFLILSGVFAVNSSHNVGMILMIISFVAFGLGILSFVILLVLGIIGWFYNKFGNLLDQGKKVFGK